MQTVEIFNGRTAMLATVGYVVQEIVTGIFMIVLLLYSGIYYYIDIKFIN